jgi:UDP-N-acetylmuramoyl-L-alanyl-D-glutamate--2,6-diaminopimelate ligase
LRALPPPPTWHRELATVGVTGTNGKTTATTFVAAALGTIVAPVARITTVGKYVGDERLALGATHADFIETMRLCRERGGRLAAIELTSEALARGFARAWPCRVGVFTNLTRDHLDAHGSAEHYLASKAQLFVGLAQGGTAVLNGCDPAGELLAGVTPTALTRRLYGVRSRGEPWAKLDLEASSIEESLEGTSAQLRWGAGAPEGAPSTLTLRAIGRVYVENALAALLGAVAMGADVQRAAAAIERCAAPAGRFELVARSPAVAIDYAHTPDAMARLVASARALVERAGAGRVTLVFGAGGERDQGKRPLMGAAAGAADRVVLTSDNPRREDPSAIARAVRAGIPRATDLTVELDRRRAIERAVREAAPEDLVIIAGKGHEATQTIGEERVPFSDREVAKEAHAKRSG